MNMAAQIPSETTTDLRVGRRIHCKLYGGKNGTITSVEGEPGLGNNRRMMGGVVNVVTGPEASISVVWDHGGVSIRVPECIATGVQWYFLDEPDRSQVEIDEALAYAKEVAEKAEKAKQAAAKAFDDSVAAYRVADEFKHYEQTPTEGRTDRSKLAAKNIRKCLKDNFPGVKFSVRKDGYDCIRISWPRADHGDAVNHNTVEEAVADFKTGHYCPHEDYHSSKDSPFNMVFGGVDYLFAQPSFD